MIDSCQIYVIGNASPVDKCAQPDVSETVLIWCKDQYCFRDSERPVNTVSYTTGPFQTADGKLAESTMGEGEACST